MMKIQFGAFLFILLLTAGCQSTAPASTEAAGAATTQETAETSGAGASGAGAAAAGAPEGQTSGFLGDYSQLKPAPDREGVMLFIDKSGDYRPFTKVMFDPVQVYVAPSPAQAQLAPDVVNRMSENFLVSFRKALEPKYQVVATPGPDVLRVRTAITGIQPVKPEREAIDYLPFKALYNVGREAVGSGRRVAEMTAEMEVLAPNGKRIAAATATRKGDKVLPQGEKVTWSQLSSITDYWAKSFRQRLDELRGEAPSQK